MKIFYKIKKLFLNKNFFIFVIIGIINTIIFNEYYLICLAFLPYLTSSIIAYLISMICSFFMNTIINFKVKPTLKRFLLFPISGIATLLTQTIGLSILVEFLNINEKLAGFLASLIAIPFSFIIMKYIIKK